MNRLAPAGRQGLAGKAARGPGQRPGRGVRRDERAKVRPQLAPGAQVHVVDPDLHRGLAIAGPLLGRSLCVEVHDGVSGFLSRPRSGAVLMDDDPSRDPAALLEAMHRQVGCLPVAFYAPAPSPRRILHALVAGAIDYFEWPCGPAKLRETAIGLIMQGERRAAIATLETRAGELVKRLNRREHAVLRSLMAGAGERQTAGELAIGSGPVRAHRAQLLRRLGVRTLADAVRIGIYAGLDGSARGNREADLPLTF